VVLWSGLVALVGLSRLTGSVEALVGVVAAVHTVVLALLVTLSQRPWPRRA
jgi:hypothetical protein